jgi:vitamin B12 transporter
VASNVIGWDNGVPSSQTTDHQGSQAQARFGLPWAQVTAGLDWVAYAMETTWTPQKTEYENRAGFLLAKGMFLEKRLIVDGGLRYDTYEVAMQEPAGPRAKDSRLTPSAGLAYLLTEAWKARIHYGRAFVMPGADQLAADYITWGTHYLGNPNLRPESSQTWEGGVSYKRATLEAGLCYFQTSFRDKIETVAVAGTSSWDNVGRAKVSGVEGEFSYDVGSLFSWPYEVKLFASFVYHDTSRDLENHQDLKYINTWHSAYGVRVADDDGLSARLNFAYSGRQIIDDRQSGVLPAPEVEMGGFTVADVTVSKRLVAFRDAGSLLLRGDIANLLDTEYAYVKGYPMPGRVFTLGLDWEY